MYLKTLYIKIQKGLARVKCNFVVAKQTNKQKKKHCEPVYNTYPKHGKQVLTRFQDQKLIFLQLNKRSPDKINFQRVSKTRLVSFLGLT